MEQGASFSRGRFLRRGSRSEMFDDRRRPSLDSSSMSSHRPPHILPPRGSYRGGRISSHNGMGRGTSMHDKRRPPCPPPSQSDNGQYHQNRPFEGVRLGRGGMNGFIPMGRGVPMHDMGMPPLPPFFPPPLPFPLPPPLSYPPIIMANHHLLDQTINNNNWTPPSPTTTTLEYRPFRYTSAGTGGPLDGYQVGKWNWIAPSFRMVAVKKIEEEPEKNEYTVLLRKRAFAQVLVSVCHQFNLTVDVDRTEEVEMRKRGEEEERADRLPVCELIRRAIRVLPDERKGHERWIVELRVNNSGGWKPLLLDFAHELLRRMEMGIDVNHEMPSISCHSLNFFPLSCITSHMSLNMKSLGFGVIHNNGERATHWRIEDHGQYGDDIVTDFQYDRRLIEVAYEQETTEVNEVTGRKEHVHKKYKIRINLDSIRRIILDQAGKVAADHPRKKGGSSWTTRFRLTLVVSYPPKFSSSYRTRNVDDNNNNNVFNWEPLDGYHPPNSPRSPRSPKAPGLFYPMRAGNRNEGRAEPIKFSDWEYSLRLGRGWSRHDESTEAINECNAITFDFADQSRRDMIYEIVARLRHRTGKAIEFASMTEVEMIEGCIHNNKTGQKEMVSPYEVTEPFDARVRNILYNACFINAERRCRLEKEINGTRVTVRDHGKHRQKILHKWAENECFRIQSLLEGILQRGPLVKNQLLVSKEVWESFVDLVIDVYKKNDKLTLAVLERMLSMLSEERCVQSVRWLLEKEFHNNRSNDESVELEMEGRGFMKVHRMLITPSRKFYVGVEIVMGNRVLRRYSKTGTEIIRVTFRDDNGDKLHPVFVGGIIIERTLGQILSHMRDGGIQLGGRRFIYLGNSNSQMRDHGAYFIHDKSDVAAIRKELGLFENLENIPRYMARFGQCFTQARSSQIKLRIDETGVMGDVVGGQRPMEKELKLERGERRTKKEEHKEGKPYIFSDGVGSISYDLAKRITDELGWPRVPSAIQIRHRGEKGLVCVDPVMDAKNDLRKLMLKKDRYGCNPRPDTHLLVRPSMMKFEVVISDRRAITQLELVKNAQPCALFLNRPFINILDQVSALQSMECNRRVSGRIEEMQRNDLAESFEALIHEARAEKMLRDKVTFPIMTDILQRRIEITTEPFMRGLLKATVRSMLNKQLRKMQIRVPTNLGRSMFGVIDTTGQLQCGQVFVRVSRNVDRKHPSLNSAGQITLTGRVLVTKNPSIVAGDVRVLEAVVIPELVAQGLSDVIVFPQHGPRPHPDEMAGSDLDGDEYSVIWDPQLFFEYNMPAMIYPATDPNNEWPIIPLTLNSDLSRFYVQTVCSDQVGLFCHAHLAQSDMLGIEAGVCNDIALKIAQALDFQKTGTAPGELRRDEVQIGFGRVIPPERPVRKPDFMLKHRDPAYLSRGVMGRIYDEVERYITAMEIAEDGIREVQLDPSIDFPGWEEYKESATVAMELYNYKLKSLMETYGVDTEAEICSGSILNIKKLVSEKEADDHCLYNTTMIIEEKLRGLVAEARLEFFNDLCDWRTELYRRDSSLNYENPRPASILEMYTKKPTDEMKKKAVAAYRVSYERANRSLSIRDEESALLSFPWCFYDVLAAVREDSLAFVDARMPLTRKVDAFVPDFVSDPLEAYPYFLFREMHMNGHGTTARMLRETKNLADLCFVLVKWAEQAGVFEEETRFTRDHLVSLICCFGLRAYTTGYEFLCKPTGSDKELVRVGDFLVEFMQFISSSFFREMRHLSLAAVDLPNIFVRGQQKALHEAAVISYLHLTVTHRLDVFKPWEPTGVERAASRIREMKSFVVELPALIVQRRPCLQAVRDVVWRASDVQQLEMRPFGARDRVLISAVGNYASFLSLRNLLIVSPPPKAAMFLAGANDHFSALVWKKIRAMATDEEISIIKYVLDQCAPAGQRRRRSYRGGH